MSFLLTVLHYSVNVQGTLGSRHVGSRHVLGSRHVRLIGGQVTNNDSITNVHRRLAAIKFVDTFS